MLFNNESKNIIRDKLIRLIESSAYCLTALGETKMLQDRQIEEAYKELSEAMGAVIDERAISHAEYGYILYRAKLKLKLAHFKG